MRDLPGGTVTFLFTDIEGSTRLLHNLGPEAYARALAEHRRVLREAFARHRGIEVDTQGDAFFVAFSTAPDALAAAKEGQEALFGGPIRVRMGLHTGTPQLAEEGYVGVDVHRAARIAAVGHGGQVLVSASTASLVDRSSLLDLGEHRLNDLSAPERIYQFGEGDFALLRTLYRTNLPVPATPFLGREREMGEVTTLLVRPETRLITLTGPGGTGKTRLGLQAAAEAAEAFPDGLFWVPLATFRDPHLVLEQAAKALDAKDGVADHIGDKRLLLLLDNFEHVAEAAPAIVDLLSACPNLKLLVTSRDPLHLAAEHEYGVPPLEEAEAVALFRERGTTAEPEDAVRAICLRLDCLPLAVELAAARTRALSPEQILQRLEYRLPLLTGGPRDAPERQRTLRATIEWSYDLLTFEERRLFARFAVFAGGCTLEAAEEVAGADLDTLQSLVEKHLLRHSEERFWMLETIREYALDRAEESGEAAQFRARHAEHFLALAEHVDAELDATGGPGAIDRLHRELENFRAALTFLVDGPTPELGLRLAAGLGGVWSFRRPSEGRRQLEAALGRAPHATAELRARALEQAANAAYYQGDHVAAEAFCTQALALYRAAGDERHVARVLVRLGTAVAAQGDLARAMAMCEESLDLSRRRPYKPEMAYGLHVLGSLAWREGDHSVALARTLESVEVAREIGYVSILTASLGTLGELALLAGDLVEARGRFQEALRVGRGIGDWVYQYGLLGLAAAAAASGEPERAGQLWGAFSAVADEADVNLFPGDRAWYERVIAKAEGPAFAAAVEKGRRMGAEAAVEYALSETD